MSVGSRAIQVVSVSLGSSSRDAEAEVDFAGYRARIRRVGCDGDKEKMRRMLRQLDSDPGVDSIALGGIDRIWVVGARRYVVRDAERLARVVRSKPVVCGFGVKTTLELATTEKLFAAGHLSPDQRVLFLSLAERYALGHLLWSHGCSMIFGDLMFTLGLSVPLRSLRSAMVLARLMLPLARQIPIQFFYPQGAEQEKRTPKFVEYFDWADVIAGDFLLLKRFAPDDLRGKVVLTNTTTESDRSWLVAAGVHKLITLSPRIEGRTFGANVSEALIVAVLTREGMEPKREHYPKVLERYAPPLSIEILNARAQ